MATNIPDLAPRTDLVQLDDAGLADRLDRAWQANLSLRKRYGWLLYWSELLNSGTPTLTTDDPWDYQSPSYIRREISDIIAETERRIQVRKNAGI